MTNSLTTMILTPDNFRAHVESMWKPETKNQLMMWIENGLYIYSNVPILQEIWDKEYDERTDELD